MKHRSTTALEQCQGCSGTLIKQMSGSDKKELTPVAYDDGDGIKDQIIMTGPLSQVFTQAMNVVFQKKPLELTDNPPDAEVPVENKQDKSAVESYANDVYMEKMINEMSTSPELAVVLSNFDVKSVNDHIADVRNNEQPAEAPDITTVLVTSASDIVKPEFYERLLNDNFNGIAVVVGDMGGSGALQSPKEEYKIFESDKETASSIERLFEDTGVKVCFGMEAFAKELTKRSKFSVIAENK